MSRQHTTSRMTRNASTQQATDAMHVSRHEDSGTDESLAPSPTSSMSSTHSGLNRRFGMEQYENDRELGQGEEMGYIGIDGEEMDTPIFKTGVEDSASKQAQRDVLTADYGKRSGIGQDPEYASRDIEIRDGIWEITNLLEGFSRRFFAFKYTGELAGFFGLFSVETAKVIGCVASGGPGGEAGWKEFFTEGEKRQALVMGIVGNVLVEQVFGHILFGGTKGDVRRMVRLQREFAEADGFVRNTRCAIEAGKITSNKPGNMSMLPANFANHTNRIVGTLYTHLKPILSLDPSAPARETIVSALYTIVVHAGLLSLSMRIDPHTVYHFESLFKEDEFNPERMECLNQESMQQKNMQNADNALGLMAKEKQRRAALSAAEKKRARGDDALTQITIMQGVTAYRLGGWEAGDSTLANVRFEKKEYTNVGVRMRKLTDGVVYCRWGRARQFKDGQADDSPAQHGVAWKGGFVEFNQVRGVVDWVGVEREERKKGRTVTEADVQAILDASTFEE